MNLLHRFSRQPELILSKTPFYGGLENILKCFMSLPRRFSRTPEIISNIAPLWKSSFNIYLYMYLASNPKKLVSLSILLAPLFCPQGRFTGNHMYLTLTIQLYDPIHQIIFHTLPFYRHQNWEKHLKLYYC